MCYILCQAKLHDTFLRSDAYICRQVQWACYGVVFFNIVIIFLHIFYYQLTLSSEHVFF